jgi:hypothetical protein
MRFPGMSATHPAAKPAIESSGRLRPGAGGTAAAVPPRRAAYAGGIGARPT